MCFARAKIVQIKLKENMYKGNSTFIQPDDKNIKVWRYMDFTKFISLIATRKLYFSSANRLNDPFEGSIPKKSIEAREKLFTAFTEDGQKINSENYSRKIELSKQYYFINCWHANKYESAAMWNLYIKSDNGIAVQSTYNLLKKSFIDYEQVFLGKVKYIDHDTESIDLFNPLAPFVHKRKSFEHEKEIRALVFKIPIIDDPSSGLKYINFGIETKIDGLQIAVDVETLIQEVYVAPNTPLWYSELVNNVIKQYGYDFKVKQSQMDSSPLF